MPQELKEQIPLLKEMLEKMGIATVSLAGFEADDILGTLAKNGEEKGLDVIILSGDRDLLQLATKKNYDPSAQDCKRTDCYRRL